MRLDIDDRQITMPTIVTEIERVQSEITKCEERLDKIERSIRLKDLTEIQKQTLKEEEKGLKKRLSEHESELKHLRKENGKTTVISLVVLGLVFLIYYCFWQS